MALFTLVPNEELASHLKRDLAKTMDKITAKRSKQLSNYII